MEEYASQFKGSYPSDEEILSWQKDRTSHYMPAFENFGERMWFDKGIHEGAKYSRDLIGGLAVDFAEWIEINGWMNIEHKGQKGWIMHDFSIEPTIWYDEKMKDAYSTSDLFKLFIEEKQKANTQLK